MTNIDRSDWCLNSSNGGELRCSLRGLYTRCAVPAEVPGGECVEHARQTRRQLRLDARIASGEITAWDAERIREGWLYP